MDVNDAQNVQTAIALHHHPTSIPVQPKVTERECKKDSTSSDTAMIGVYTVKGAIKIAKLFLGIVFRPFSFPLSHNS